MTDSQIRILDFGAKGTRKKGYCANPSHSTRVTGAITGLKSSHDYKREERQWSRSNRLAGHHPVDNRWIIRRVTEPPCKLVLANESAGVATRAPRVFLFRFFEPLSSLNVHNALIPSVSLARRGKERKKRKKSCDLIAVNWGDVR